MYYLITYQHNHVITTDKQSIIKIIQHPNCIVHSFTRLADVKDYLGNYYQSQMKINDYQSILNVFGINQPKKVVSHHLLKRSMKDNHPTYYLYTDGGCRYGTSNSAWAFSLHDQSKHLMYEDSKGVFNATNNQMEIQALIRGLEYLKSQGLDSDKILVVSDSMYLINSVTAWMDKWRKNNWHKKGGLKNADQWRYLYDLMSTFINTSIMWVKGHDSTAGNIEVDRLLNQTMDQM